MKKIYVLCTAVLVLAALAFVLVKSKSRFQVAPEPAGKPGSFENTVPDAMAEVIALDATLKPSDQELVIYYVRPDKNYEKWALWMWASPGGDGGAVWPYTQHWNVENGIGYMRFHMDGSDTGGTTFTSKDGTVGLIVREKSEWNKDGDEDRIWDTNVSNKVVIFSGDASTYAAQEYKPVMRSAELVELNRIDITLSGKYGLDVDGGTSGFSVVTSTGKSYSVAKTYNTLAPDNPSDNMTRNVSIILSEMADIADSLIVKNPVFLKDAPVNNAKIAIKAAESMSPASDVELGCLYKDGRAVFNLWAPTSSSATLNLYKKSDADKADYTATMKKNEENGVWTVAFDQVDSDGFFYDFTLQNAKGSVTVLDPYARSMSADRKGAGAGRAAVINLESDKAGKVSAPYVNLAKREDAIIYEVSIRDFTVSPDSGVKAVPGTYKAFIEKLPYLKKLGITHVQFMPVVNFLNTDEMNKAYENSGTVNGNNYNWGYDPHNYFTPEGWFATDATDPYCRVRELRELINECHKAGLGVLLDVVYNHMGDTRFLDDIVPGYYFRLDSKGACTSNSGCGNDTATEHKMMKRLVVDSTSYWVKNYKVDGFRFDLMGLMEASSVIDSYNSCAKINPSVLFVGEGWKMYNGEKGTVGMDQDYMLKTDCVAVFNDEFRDAIKAGGFNETGRGFITKKAVDSDRLFNNVIGRPMSNYRADQPGDSVQYTVCHDGLTLHDAITNNLALDVKKDVRQIVQRIQLANFFCMTSQGIAFLHAGQERGRTKPNIRGSTNESVGSFVRNSYDSSDNINQFVWTLAPAYQNLPDYTRGLIAIRKTYDVFRLGDAEKIAKNFKKLTTNEDFVFGYTAEHKDGRWIVIVNADEKSVAVNTGISLKGGVVYVDKNTASEDGIKVPSGVKLDGTTVVLEPLTATMIRVTQN